jgi:hypothetical protein
MVLERLAALAPMHPQACVKCLTMMLEAGRDPWLLHGWQDEQRRILSAAVRSEDADARATAKQLINRLAAWGQSSYRDLLNY